MTADSELIARLRADLTAARFSVDRLDALWGSAAEAALGRGNRVPAERALAGKDDPAATLARLFVLGESVSCVAADAALPALGVPGAVDLALVAIAGEVVRPLVDLRPYGYLDTRGTGEWWIASDLGELATGRELRRRPRARGRRRVGDAQRSAAARRRSTRRSTSEPDAASRPCTPDAGLGGSSRPTSRSAPSCSRGSTPS